MRKNKIYFFVSLMGMLFMSGCTVKVFDVNGLPIQQNTNQTQTNFTSDSQPTNSKESQTAQVQNIGEFFQTFTGIVQNIKDQKQSRKNSNNNSNIFMNDELDGLLSKSQSAKPNKSKWLFVVGIEKYEFTDNISYASRSAEMFSKVAIKKLGVPKENSYVLYKQ